MMVGVHSHKLGSTVKNVDILKMHGELMTG